VGGDHPAACGRHPSQEGNRFGRGCDHPAAEAAPLHRGDRDVGLDVGGDHPAACGRHPSTEGIGTEGLDVGCGEVDVGQEFVIAKHR
jgi:hypothetical protein